MRRHRTWEPVGPFLCAGTVLESPRLQLWSSCGPSGVSFLCAGIVLGSPRLRLRSTVGQGCPIWVANGSPAGLQLNHDLDNLASHGSNWAFKWASRYPIPSRGTPCGYHDWATCPIIVRIGPAATLSYKLGQTEPYGTTWCSHGPMLECGFQYFVFSTDCSVTTRCIRYGVLKS